MEAMLPTQLLRESTLRGARDTEDAATTAWSFFTALCYKAGNMPWELQFGVPRTCRPKPFSSSDPGLSPVPSLGLLGIAPGAFSRAA
jgi:hypothetical protein